MWLSVTPEQKLLCHTNITASWPASLSAVCLHLSSHNTYATVSVQLKKKKKRGVWMETMVMTYDRGSDTPPQSPQHRAKLQQSVAEPLFFPPLDSKKCTTLWVWSVWLGIWLKKNCSLAPFLCVFYATGSLNNRWELNLEVFILGIYLARDHRPGTWQPC